MSWISAIFILFSLAFILPATVVFAEVIAALVLPDRKPFLKRDHKGRARIAVLIPAHNESDAVLPTIVDVKSQLHLGDRLVVIADNCSDDTAIVAAKAGALVIERHDASKIGKGYALDFGVQALRRDPPDVVLMVDADCRLSADSIDLLTHACVEAGRPVQARYLMIAPENAGLNVRVAQFAWRLKNWIRPLGLHKLNLPCQLTGSGMAFPWKVINEAKLDNGWLVEDLKLGMDLAIAGFPPLFCPSAICISEFAASSRGAQSQRQRWEHGHVQTILQMPKAILASIRWGKMGTIALIADLIVPPLSLFVIMIGGMTIIAGALAILGISPIAFLINLVGTITLAAAVFLTWFKYGRDVLPFRNVASIVVYVLSKVPLYARIFSGRAAGEWVRTDRGSSSKFQTDLTAEGRDKAA